MNSKSKKFLAYVISWVVLLAGGIIGTVFREPLGDETRTAMLHSRFHEALVYFGSPELWSAAIQTLWVFLLTGALSFAFGILLAWFLFYSRFGATWVEPFVQFMRPIPSIAMIAICAMIFSVTSGYLAILVAFIGSLWPFTITVLDTFRRVPKALHESTLSLGKNERAFYGHVLFFASLPGLFDAVRLVAPITLLLTVTTQYFYQHLGGLGSILYSKHNGLEYPKVICIVVVMSLISIGFERLIDKFENLICKWRVDATQTHEHT